MTAGRHGQGVSSPELPRREPYRTWPGALAVFAVILAYVGTLIVVDAETSPDLERVEAGSVLQVGPSVAFAPRNGWYLDTTDSTQDPSAPSVTLIGSAANFQINVSAWNSTLAEEVKRQKSIIESFGDSRLIGDDASFSVPGGLEGTTFSFFGHERQGRVWISVDEQADRAITVVGRSSDTVFQQSLPDFQDMLDSIRTEQQS